MSIFYMAAIGVVALGLTLGVLGALGPLEDRRRYGR